MARSIIFDTETTGLDPAQGDKVIEIAALELENDMPTGMYHHVLINPERDIPPEATRIHGFTLNDLRGKPTFAQIADDFLTFVGDSKLIAHNAPFDFKFINAELVQCGRKPLDYESRAIDTVVMARKKYPGMPASLDALCRRFGIDLSERGTHNALLDCRLLADVYVELMGGKQRRLDMESTISAKEGHTESEQRLTIKNRNPRLMAKPGKEATELWEHFMTGVTDPLWYK